MCRIDLCGQIGVKISSYRDTQFIKINPLNRPWGRFLPREDNNMQPDIIFTVPASRKFSVQIFSILKHYITYQIHKLIGFQ